MKRRNFIYQSSLIAMSMGVFGKIKWDGQAWVGEDPTTTDILGPFYRQGDQLFVKLNGQIMEAMDYKGDNSFEGGLSRVKATFELQTGGQVKVKAAYMVGPDKYETVEGEKLLKYPA